MKSTRRNSGRPQRRSRLPPSFRRAQDEFVPPSEKVNIAVVGVGGQGRAISPWPVPQDDAQVIAVADAMEEFSLEAFYYNGLGGQAVSALIEKHYAQKTPNFRCCSV